MADEPHDFSVGSNMQENRIFEVSAATQAQVKSKVFFTKDISVNGLLTIYSKINSDITGKIAIKLHTGEPHGPNILPGEMVKALQQHIPNSTLVETNTLYKGKRYTTTDHRETLRINGWDFCSVDIMDEDGAVMIPVKGGKHFKEMSVGKHMLNYDSMVVLTHFKGHAMGGLGGLAEEYRHRLRGWSNRQENGPRRSG